VNKIIIKPVTKTLSLLTLVALTSACSTQNLSSIPGSQLYGQEKKEVKQEVKKVAEVAKKKTVVPEVNTDTSAPMRKTVLKAPTVVATTNTTTASNTTTSAFGVKASEPKMQAAAPVAAKVVTAPPVYKATVATIPKQAVSNVAAQAKPVSKTQSTTRRLTLNGSATFKTGSSRLSTAGKKTLATLASSLSSPNTKISRLLIEGHTDSAGSAASNQVLSLKRANAVADYLAEKGLMRSSMTTVGLGESKPVADNKTKTGRAQNRRVEITATGSRQTTR
jgi:OOP family OmpA-OmpF porin